MSAVVEWRDVRVILQALVPLQEELQALVVQGTHRLGQVPAVFGVDSVLTMAGAATVMTFVEATQVGAGASSSSAVVKGWVSRER